LAYAIAGVEIRQIYPAKENRIAEKYQAIRKSIFMVIITRVKERFFSLKDYVYAGIKTVKSHTECVIVAVEIKLRFRSMVWKGLDMLKINRESLSPDTILNQRFLCRYVFGIR
jgi:hypothetical protein